MIEPFNTFTQSVDFITEKVAKERFKMAWIEASDPVAAVYEMAMSVQSGVSNCALWVNAGECIEPLVKATIRGWNEDRLLAIDSWDGIVQPVIQSHIDAVQGWLKDAFDGAAVKTQLRSNEKTTTMRGLHDCHVDGNDGDLRFLQSIECASTCLIEEKDMVFRPLTIEDSAKLAQYYGTDLETEKKHIGTEEWTLRMDGHPVTFWEAPRNSLLLISDIHVKNGKPVMHTVPFKPAEQEPDYRTVTLYDLKVSP